MRVKDLMPTAEQAAEAVARGKRYWTLNYSVSAHCCYVATVIDLKQPPLFGGQYPTVCECFEQSHADRIATALNKGISK